MAFDKVVDSAQLDGALTSTADAIRVKTGETEEIVWDETTGFSEAILAITGTGSGGGRLPAGYTELPYLNSDGYQCIDTGWRAKAGDTLTMSMALSSGNAEAGFGGYPDQFELYYKFSYTSNPTVTVWTNKTSITVLENYSGTVEYGQVTTLKIRFDSDMTDGTVRLFAYRLDRLRFAGKMLFATAESASGEKYFDLVPCIHPSGELGMYDLVTDVLFNNAGSGSFF